jgi:hypothetical protein
MIPLPDDCSLHTWNCILVNSGIQKSLYEYNVMTFCVFFNFYISKYWEKNIME